MKTIIYFLLAICAILYFAVLSVVNIYGVDIINSWGTWGTILMGIHDYGALAIIFVFALINFFGNPIKIVFFVLLVLVIIFYILTCAMPGVFKGLLGLIGGESEGVEAIVSWLNV